MSKRTLDSFFKPPAAKKMRVESSTLDQSATDFTKHATYPWPMPFFPPHIIVELEDLRSAKGRVINDKPHLDLLYFQPFIPRAVEHEVFDFLRSNLFFYRVKYTIKRFGKETLINTPRFTTVFGIDETSRFITEHPSIVQAADKTTPAPPKKYKCQPRPIPECLDLLRRVTEAATSTRFNFCLVNYYASGSDSISYHSDDERFLEPEPAIASFSLGAKRDFLLKHKEIPPKEGETALSTEPIKLPLGSGDMLLMRGKTQPNWLHSIPKRKSEEADKGRINITFRKAMVPGGTENYYRYNVGDGEVYKWEREKKQMALWESSKI